MSEVCIKCGIQQKNNSFPLWEKYGNDYAQPCTSCLKEMKDNNEPIILTNHYTGEQKEVKVVYG